MDATAWTNLDNILLSETSQSRKARYYIIPLIQNVQNGQIYRDEK